MTIRLNKIRLIERGANDMSEKLKSDEKDAKLIFQASYINNNGETKFIIADEETTIGELFDHVDNKTQMKLMEVSCIERLKKRL